MARRAAAAAATTLMRRHILGSAPPRLARSCGCYRAYDPSKDPREMISYLGDWHLTEQAMKHPGMDYRHWFVRIPKARRLRKKGKDYIIEYFGRILQIALPDTDLPDLMKTIYKVVLDSEENSGFGCEIDWDAADRIKGVYRVESVSPDYYPDPEYKDYGGELVVDGKVVERPGPKLKMEDKVESAEKKIG